MTSSKKVGAILGAVGIMVLLLVTTTPWKALASPRPAAGPAPVNHSGAVYDQGSAFSTGNTSSTAAVSLTGPVAQGDLLVGWFAQFNVAGHVTVSDSVNGAWTRAPSALAFQSDTGDIALYYLANAKASPGVTITVAASAPVYLQGSVADYSGMALAGPLDQLATARGIGTSVASGTTPPVASGELVYSATMTGAVPGSVLPGTTNGVAYTPRASTADGNSSEQDVLSAAAGPQASSATLGTSADWYTVAAAFRLFPTNDTSPPGPPSNLAVLSNAASRVALSWSAGSGDLTGYSVYRNGALIATTAPGQTSYLDETVTGGTTETYTVDAFDGADLHSARTAPVQVTTPVSSPSFIQGNAGSTGTRVTSVTLTLPRPVSAGDLLVGWFAQYDVSGPVNVSDNVNGPWTRTTASETFTNGAGDIALEYVPDSKAAPQGLTVTVSASAPAYLQEAVAEYRGVDQVAPLATALVGIGTTANVSVGPSSPVPAGDLVVGGTLTAGQPGSISPGSSLGVPYALDAVNGSASASIEDILSSAAGAQSATSTLAAASTSYTVLAVFKPAAGVPAGDVYVPLASPQRVTDTRSGSGQPNAGRPIPFGQSLIVALGSAVPVGATAAVVNLTAVDAAGPGYLAAYPTGSAPPTASSVNYVRGSPTCTAVDCVVPNLVTVPIGTRNQISVLNGPAGPLGATDAVVDLEGYYVPVGSSPAGEYHPATPTRIVDTRCGGLPTPTFCAGEGLVGANRSLTTVPGGGTITVATGNTAAEAAVLNVTFTDTAAVGFSSVFAAGSPRPVSSNANWVPGQTASSRVITPVGANGDVEVFNGSPQSVDVVIDTSGYFAASSGAPSGGSVFVPTPPRRITDTRPGSGAANAGATLGPAGNLTVAVPGVPAGATAASLNVTEASATASSYFSVTPTATTGGPASSDLNFGPGEIRANADLATLAPADTFNLFNYTGNANAVVDMAGYFIPGGP